MERSEDLDSPDRVHELRALINSKSSLKKYYLEVYHKYAQSLSHCPSEGIALELGSGAGFVKEIIPEMVTSDVIKYEGNDQVVDATKMPFADGSLRFIAMMNVFHHIPDVAAFFKEAERCLKPGGRILIVDQHPGLFSTFIFRNLHHEPFEPKSKSWSFKTAGPLSGANGALAWIVFRRDIEMFKSHYSGLKFLRYETHTPLRYWLCGGLKVWSLLPSWAFGTATFLDKIILKISAELGSFTDIELIKR